MPNSAVGDHGNERGVCVCVCVCVCVSPLQYDLLCLEHVSARPSPDGAKDSTPVAGRSSHK